MEIISGLICICILCVILKHGLIYKYHCHLVQLFKGKIDLNFQGLIFSQKNDMKLYIFTIFKCAGCLAETL